MNSPYCDFAGKVALITGGSRGLGLEMAKGFAAHGADVVISSRKLDQCEAAVAEIRAMGRRAIAHACHVGQWDALPSLVDAAYDAFGKVDVLVNNAGIAPVAPRAIDVTEDLFDKTVAVNFKGPFRLSALVGERMKAAGGGAIINVTSTGAVRPQASFAVYAGAKAALNTVTKALALEMGPSVRVNAIMAGPFWTDIAKSWREDVDKSIDSAVRRIGRPEEVVSSALYFASERSSYTTGAVLTVDGGVA
jgi:NAD(P)-dependent dehydrogenase (short-subunit alcohol dehydrogenase family)